MRLKDFVRYTIEEMEELLPLEFEVGISLNKKKEVEVDSYSQNRIKFTVVKK